MEDKTMQTKKWQRPDTKFELTEEKKGCSNTSKSLIQGRKTEGLVVK